MTDALREKLLYTCRNVIHLDLSEAEVNVKPYAVFDMTTAPLIDKDGVYGYEGDTSIRIVGTSIDELETLRAGIEGAIASEMRSDSFFSRLDDVVEECVEGQWTIELTYTLRQYADWVEPVEQTINENTE